MDNYTIDPSRLEVNGFNIGDVIRHKNSLTFEKLGYLVVEGFCYPYQYPTPLMKVWHKKENKNGWENYWYLCNLVYFDIVESAKDKSLQIFEDPQYQDLFE